MLSDLFDLYQGQIEPFKSSLSCFNSMTVLFIEPNEKLFVAALHKGLRIGTFSETLFIQRLVTMDVIHRRVENHIDAEEATPPKKARDAKDDRNCVQKGRRGDLRSDTPPSE